MLPINPETEARNIELDRMLPEVQDMTAKRIADALTWCAEAHRDQRMPSWVLADLILSCLRQTFAIETGDDPDQDQNNVYQQQPSAKPSTSWERDRDAFLAYLNGRGWQYNDVADFCKSLGKPGPEAMTHEARQSLTRWLDGAGAERWSQFRAEPLTVGEAIELIW